MFAFIHCLSRLLTSKLPTVREDYWTLSKRPDGLDHVFYRLNNGRQLHYVTTSTPDAQNDAQPQGLVILLHGWPDSWILWRKAIRSSLASSKNARFVALDLPGFGGSDALDKHDATGVLEAVTEFILAMRDRYLDGEERAKVLVVGHDWGALVGFKLAAQAPELADRFILINSTLVCFLQAFLPISITDIPQARTRIGECRPQTQLRQADVAQVVRPTQTFESPSKHQRHYLTCLPSTGQVVLRLHFQLAGTASIALR